MCSFKTGELSKKKNAGGEKAVDITRSPQDDDVKNLRYGSWQQPG